MDNKKPKANLSQMLIEGLRLITHCPLCESNYQPVSAKVIEEKDNAHLVYIRCKKCLSSVLAVVITGSAGISSMCLVTDLNSEDIRRFQHAERLSIDDVIDIHEAVSSRDFAQSFIGNQLSTKNH